jgi:hypothetical protein
MIWNRNEHMGGLNTIGHTNMMLDIVGNATTGCGKGGIIDRLDFDVASYGNLRRDCCLSCGLP